MFELRSLSGDSNTQGERFNPSRQKRKFSAKPGATLSDRNLANYLRYSLAELMIHVINVHANRSFVALRSMIDECLCSDRRCGVKRIIVFVRPKRLLLLVGLFSRLVYRKFHRPCFLVGLSCSRRTGQQLLCGTRFDILSEKLREEGERDGCCRQGIDRATSVCLRNDR